MKKRSVRTLLYGDPKARLTPVLDAALLLGLAAFLALAGTRARGAGLLVLLSLWANLALIRLFVGAMRLSGIRIRRAQWLAVAAVLAVLGACYAYSLLTRRFLYYWDYSCYYNIQIDVENAFRRGFRRGLAAVWGSVGLDYTRFVSLFFEWLFVWTPRTENWYVAVCAAVILPYLGVGLAMLLNQISVRMRVRRPGSFFTLGMATALALPLLHYALVLGQPDLFGLVPITLVVSLTLGTAFDDADWRRWLLLFAATLMLALTRRWYMFWVVGYYAAYALWRLLPPLLRKDWRRAGRRLLRLCVFGAGSVLGACALAMPLVRYVVTNNLSFSYGYYRNGGLIGEIRNQYAYLGLGMSLVVLLGAAFGLVRRQWRGLTAAAVTAWTLSVALFTRVQNMGPHQALLLLPEYLLLTWSLLDALLSLTRRSAACLAAAGVCAIAGLNGVSAWSGALSLPPLTASLSLQVPARDDIEEVGEVLDWLSAHTDEGASNYIIPHGYPYNPDVFRYARMPEPVSPPLPYGFAIPGTQAFPIADVMNAQYVLTCEPFCDSGVAYKLNDAFLALRDEGVFTLARTFDMHNGYTFYAYRRSETPSLREALRYLDAFAAEDALYPDFYSQAIREYCLSMGWAWPDSSVS